MVNLNALCVLNKTEQLELVFLNSRPHVPCVTKVWLNALVPDIEVFPESYKLFRRDPPSWGGGVTLKNSVNAVVLKRIDEHGSLLLRIRCWGNS